MTDTAQGGAILALDSSAALCAAAILRGGVVLSARSEPMARGQAERLVPLAQEVAAEAGAAPRDLAAVAVCTGPGNFTGVRIGVAAARGLALALGVPAIGVNRLEALAADTPGELVLAALPTRRGEIHAGLFETGAPVNVAVPVPVAAPVTGAPADVAAALAPHLAGRAAAMRGAEAEALAEALSALGAAPFAAVDPADSPAPGTIARLAAAALAAGGAPPRAAPVYLRPADAAPSSDRPPALLDG
ncbi:tRNA (adenosine(37)-N6)-threonylcarbamoyltransferase complex dimerization subunit type 1 TsaB [Rhodovulum sp. DZ06]|uniref:tRNA (adenosine(37)-N6)-threonylcarbamoyltransferase complex dimerization subunit type 1 TsaB n=1 Tax=Rhodovulum sp. DZ06 TaxID=3425126 RepID=UPI003D346CD0